MSPDQEFLNLAGAKSENQTLFDELAGLVPAERQAEYYRVIAHTRTVSPNNEMLRLQRSNGHARAAYARNARGESKTKDSAAIRAWKRRMASAEGQEIAGKAQPPAKP